jgi:nitroreductase
MLLQATALGLGTVWKSLMPEWESGVKKIIEAPENFQAINIIVVGFAKNKLEAHSDADFASQKIHVEKW